MSAVVDTAMMVLLILVMVCAFVAIVLGMWYTMPQQGQERLAVALRRIPGRRARVRSRPPISAVHVDAQLLSARGKDDDVEDFLWTACVVAGRHVRRLVDAERPATLLLTCGAESLVIEVPLASRKARRLIMDPRDWHLAACAGLEDLDANVHAMRRVCGTCGVKPPFTVTPEELRRCVVWGEPSHVQVRRWRPEARGA